MSFRNRLALFLIVTLVCVQAATAVFTYVYLRHDLEEQGKRELASNMAAFTRQLDFLSRRASDGVEVLALDYALREAIAARNEGTELSALRNHGMRIGATRMMLIGLDGAIAADTGGPSRRSGVFADAPLLEAATLNDRGTALITEGNRIFWVIVVPVRAPLPIAFIAAFIPVDDVLLRKIREISSSQNAIMLAVRQGNAWQPAARTTGDIVPDFPPVPETGENTALVTHGGAEYLAIAAPLETADSSRPIAAIVALPLENALSAYRRLMTWMVAVLSLSVAAAAGGAALIVRRFARPLEVLAGTAQRIAEGDYSDPPVIHQSDEIGRLSRAIANMTRAIAERETALTGAMETAELARSQAVKANEAKSHFLANMSHELRTPLNAIVGFGEMLEQEVLGPLGSGRYLEYARHIRESGDHLRGLFERMLELADAGSRKLDIATDPVPASELLRSAAELHRSLAKKENIHLALHIAPDENASLRGDALKLRQAIANVIHNAIKFTPAKGTVAISSMVDNTCYRIRVSDTGVGILPELQSLVLQPFHRLRSALDGQHQGAGLGLPYAKVIVESHGGTISISSEAGHGTVVAIDLPLSLGAVSHAA
ncbi:MAG TPA: ATP-binding protein [Rhizomicrobium sp.]|jgi:signal transduction histidine kinase